MTASAPIWLPMATALHRLPDGTSHFDWFFGRTMNTSHPDDRSARTFRCARDPREACAGWTAQIEPLADHRVHYLTAVDERCLADGSTVTPLQRGQWMDAGIDDIIIQWHGSEAFHRIRLVGQPPLRADCTTSGSSLNAV